MDSTAAASLWVDPEAVEQTPRAVAVRDDRIDEPELDADSV
jgi:hypothetical protein